MGNGVPRVVANTTLTSLNTMFNQTNMPSLQLKYQKLKALYPSFMTYSASQADRHIWRQSTLRYAGWLLTSEVDVASAAHPYPGRSFVMWLKWLTWVQTLGPNDAGVTINGAAAQIPPAKAILDMLKAALEDQAQSPVLFNWAERAVGLMTVAVDQKPRPYGVAVHSIQAAGIAGHLDNEEDSGLP
jgi:hypothetical protein